MTVPLDLDDDIVVHDFPLHELAAACRRAGAPRWNPEHVEAAMIRLTRALDGDAGRAGTYLQHLAERNIWLWSWLAKGLSDEEIRRRVRKALGPAHTAPAPVDDEITLDDLIAAALTAETAYERILTVNRATDAHLVFAPVICVPCNRLLTFRDFVFFHLSKREDYLVPVDNCVATSKHGPTEIRPATEAEIARRQRTGSPLEVHR